MLNAARELIFRTAVASASGNASSTQQVPANQVSTIPIYQSHYLYLGLAVLITALATVATLLTYIGYWTLGRKVSMSPIEIAKAFGSPKLQNADSNADAKALVDAVGLLEARYGVTLRSNGGLVSNLMPLPYGVTAESRLDIDDPRVVRARRDGEHFLG